MLNVLFFPGKKFLSLCLLATMVFGILSVAVPATGLAQGSDTAQTDSTAKVGGTKALKSVFSEMKKVAKNDDSPLGSIIMIIGVIAIVGVAIYLAFKPEEGEKKST